MKYLIPIISLLISHPVYADSCTLEEAEGASTVTTNDGVFHYPGGCDLICPNDLNSYFECCPAENSTPAECDTYDAHAVEVLDEATGEIVYTSVHQDPVIIYPTLLDELMHWYYVATNVWWH